MNMGPSSLSKVLTDFGADLEIPRQEWVKREELLQLRLNVEDLSREVAARLAYVQIVPLLEACGEAVSCRFLLRGAVVLKIALGVTEADFASFREEMGSSPTVTLEFKLDKLKLANKWQQAARGVRVLVYIFSKALEQFLINKLDVLEKALWESETSRKIVLLVSDREILLNGPCLAVLGGTHIDKWREVVMQETIDAERLKDMYTACQDTVRWQEQWFKHLTPLHLKLRSLAGQSDLFANPLRIHLVNMAILYTADRTVLQADGTWLAIYNGANHSVEVKLRSPGEFFEAELNDGVEALLEMVEWSYEPNKVSDRLPIVQICVVRSLSGAEPAVRYRSLLHNAIGIYNSSKWDWKAFVENKIDAYIGQVQALEDYVTNVISTYAGNISTIVKNLSETMLAAVAVSIGSFIAALFGDKFNPKVFALGLRIYAGYVFLFPLIYNMSIQWGQYKLMEKDFKYRCRRFGERLYPERVSEIVGTRVEDSQARFLFWFKATIFAYIGAIVLALIASFAAPSMISQVVPSPQKSKTTSALVSTPQPTTSPVPGTTPRNAPPKSATPRPFMP